MKKSPSVAFFYKKIRTTGKDELETYLRNAPLNYNELQFMLNVIEGYTNTELSYLHQKSRSRVAQIKRELFTRLHAYEIRKEHLAKLKSL